MLVLLTNNWELLTIKLGTLYSFHKENPLIYTESSLYYLELSNYCLEFFANSN